MQEGDLRSRSATPPSVEFMRALTDIQDTILSENDLSNLVSDVLGSVRSVPVYPEDRFRGLDTRQTEKTHTK